jgi:hypothetical protein
MTEIRDGLYEILEQDNPASVRQVFYQATVRGLVPKTEAAYKNTVGRLLVLMRRDSTIPYRWLVDGTRWMRKPATYTGLNSFIERHQHAYRRDLWAESEAYVEIWVEKEALAGTIFEVTAEYDVPLMVSRGFASESYLHSAAETIHAQCYRDAEPDAVGRVLNTRGALIYYLGDYDPSGTKIDPAIGVRRWGWTGREVGN